MCFTSLGQVLGEKPNLCGLKLPILKVKNSFSTLVTCAKTNQHTAVTGIALVLTTKRFPNIRRAKGFVLFVLYIVEIFLKIINIFNQFRIGYQPTLLLCLVVRIPFLAVHGFLLDKIHCIFTATFRSPWSTIFSCQLPTCLLLFLSLYYYPKRALQIN